MEAMLAPIVNFLAVVAILYFAGRKPFMAFLDTRSTTVGNSIVDAEIASKKAGEELAQWKSSWASSEAHAKAQKEEAAAAMARLKDTVLASAKVEATRIGKESSLVGQSEVTRARVSLQREVAEKSVKLAEAYLSSHLGEKDQQKLVSEYVEIVGNGRA